MLPARLQKQRCWSSSNRERVQARAATLQDQILARTEQRTFAQPAAEDFLQHPAQVLDDRQLLREYVVRTNQQHLDQNARMTEGIRLA